MKQILPSTAARKWSRFLPCLCLILLAFQMDAKAQSYLHGAPDLERTTLRTAFDQLDDSLLSLNRVYYVKFSLAPGASRPSQGGGGFAPPVPLHSEAPVEHGYVEISLFDSPSVSSWQGAKGWTAQVSLRIRQFRVFRPGQGWGAAQMPLIHLWEWTGGRQGGQDFVRSDTDARSQTNDGGVTEFIASVFNVPVSAVRCAKPAPEEIPQNQPAPSQRPWRARYN